MSSIHGMYPGSGVHRGSASVPALARLNELFEALKSEFEIIIQDINVHKLHRDEYEHKLQSQMNEMNQIQKNIHELERAYFKLKQQYEEELSRLRKELESRGISVSNLGSSPISSPISSTSFGVITASSIPPNLGAGILGQYTTSQNNPSTILNELGGTSLKRSRQDEKHAFIPNGGNNSPEKRSVSFKKDIIQDQSSPEHTQIVKKDGSDWLLGYNTKVPRRLNVDLLYSFDHNSVVCSVSFSHDGKLLATGSNKIVNVFNVSDGTLVCSLSEDQEKDVDQYIRSVCFHPDSKRLATGAEDRKIRVWHIYEKKVLHVLSGHEQDVYSLHYSKDGKKLASGSGGASVKVWDSETGKLLNDLHSDDYSAQNAGKDAGVTSISFSPDDQYITAGSLDRSVRVWNATNGHLIEKFEGHKDSVYSVSFSPDGRHIISGSLDKTLRIWEFLPNEKSSCIATLTAHRDFVLSVAYSNDGQWIVSGSKDKTVHFWDPATCVSQMLLQGHKNSVISIATSPTDSILATGSGDFKVRLWKYEAISSTIV